MAVLLTNKRIIVAKIETTVGTDASPTGSANAILVSNLTITPMATDMADRALVRSYLGASEQLPAAIHAQVEFEVELAGSGTVATAPAWGPLIRACGFAETITADTSVAYAPVSDSFESLTIYANVDGVKHALLSARGTFTLDLTAKSIPTIKFTFTGLYVAVADASLPTPTYTAFQTPLVVNKTNTPTLSLHSLTTGVMNSLSLDAGNTVTFRSLVGAESVDITDRQVSGSIALEAVSVATKDWWSLVKAATTGDLNVVHGTTAGNICTIDAPNVQLTQPQYQDQDGVQMLQMGLRAVPGSSGNDELTLTLT
jgi:hypothetical protein